GAFWTGALAAFVATPCTGPFMGAALGAALVLPGAAALAIFAGLGLGLALPFLAPRFAPAPRRRLPQPGPRMARFRPCTAAPSAEARPLDGQVPALDGGADGAHRPRPRLDSQPPGRGRRAGDRPCRRRAAGRRPLGRRPPPGPRPRVAPARPGRRRRARRPA